MKIAQRLACLLLSLTMVASFAACKKNPSKDGKDGDDESSSFTQTGSNNNDSDEESSDGEIIGGGAAGGVSGGATGTTGGSTGTGATGGSGTKNPGSSTTTASNPLDYTVDTKLDTAQEKKFASLKGTKVTVQTNSSVPTEDEANVIKACKEKYGLDVEIVPLSWEDMQSNIVSLVAGGTAPDLCAFSEVLALRYAYGNLALPIDKYLDKSDKVWTTNDSLTRFTYNKQCYGAADYDYDVFLVYYNKTLFNERHVKEPIDYYNEGKWTFDNFRKVAKDITIMQDDGTTVKTFGCATWNYPVFMMANGSQGVTCDSKNKWSVTVDQANAIQGMQVMHDMAADGSFLMADGYAEFRKREIAMTIERPMNAIGTYDYYNRMEDEIGMVPMPMSSSGKYYAPVVSNARFVTSRAKNPLGAVAYMYEKRIYDMQKSTNTSPAYLAQRRKVISDEHLKIYNDYMAKATPMSSTMDGLANWWDGALNRNQIWNKILIDKTQPTQAMDSIKGLMLDSLKRTVGASNVNK